MEARGLPAFHAEGLDDAVAGDGLVQNVLDLGQLVLPLAGGGAHPPADPAREKTITGTNISSTQANLPPRATTTAGDENQGEELLQELGQHLRSCELNLVDVVDDGRNQGPRRVLLEEGHRAAQHRAVKLVAQVGDDPEARVVDQVRPGIKADALDDRGRHQGNGHHGPGIGKVLRDEVLQIDGVLGAGNGEQRDVARLRGRMQHAVQHGADQQQAEGVQQADQRHQHHRAQQVEGVRPDIPQ